MKRSIEVDLLGGLAVRLNGQPLPAAAAEDAWRLFCRVLLARPAPCASAAADLWPTQPEEARAARLAAAAEALARRFGGLSPLVESGGKLQCRPEDSFTLDTERFEAACRTAETSPDTLPEALALCAGPLLPRLEGEAWVLGPARRLRAEYNGAAARWCARLEAEARWNELLAAASAACEVDPLEEAHHILLFRALQQLGMQRGIITSYPKTERLFAEELGRSAPAEITAIYRRAAAETDPLSRDVMLIQDDLAAAQHEAAPEGGPLFCSYDVFRFLYQMMARAAERSGSRAVVVLLSLRGEEGGTPEAAAAAAAMKQLRGVLAGLLRRSDTACRYSHHQYLLLLSVDKPRSADIVVERIAERSRAALQADGLQLLATKTDPSRP